MSFGTDQPMSSRRDPYALFVSSIRGYLTSIVGIALVRTWLSFSTGICSEYATSYVADYGLDLVQQIALVASCLVLALAFPRAFTNNNRGPTLLALSVAGSVAHIAGLLVTPSARAVGIAAAIYDIFLFALFVRIWCQDNIDAHVGRVAIRVAVSFLVQYALYTFALILPPEAQQAVAVSLPSLIGLCMFRPPSGERDDIPDTGAPGYRLRMPPVVLIIFSCVAAHGFIFSITAKVGVIWVVGPLLIGILVPAAVNVFPNRALVRRLALLALTTQAIGVAIALIFMTDGGATALAKSLSYSVSMTLSLVTSCVIGAQVTRDRTLVAFRPMALYFILFYVVHNLMQILRPDLTIMLASALLFLVIAAVALSLNSGGDTDKNVSDDTDDYDVTWSSIEANLLGDYGLTQRECAVTYLIATGLTAKQIAQKDDVTVNTVRSQVQAIYHKLDVHNREELVETVRQLAR